MDWFMGDFDGVIERPDWAAPVVEPDPVPWKLDPTPLPWVVARSVEDLVEPQPQPWRAGLVEAFEDRFADLVEQDRLGNHEIQNDTLEANVRKKTDDTANAIIGKI